MLPQLCFRVSVLSRLGCVTAAKHSDEHCLLCTAVRVVCTPTLSGCCVLVPGERRGESSEQHLDQRKGCRRSIELSRAETRPTKSFADVVGLSVRAWIKLSLLQPSVIDKNADNIFTRISHKKIRRMLRWR